MKKKYSFSKDQRLCRQKVIQELFQKSSFVFLYPFKIYYLPASCTQILISVSKKHIKKAVQRNRIKRQIRELYRLSQHRLFRHPLYLGIVYVGQRPEKWNFLQERWTEAIKKLFSRDETSQETFVNPCI